VEEPFSVMEGFISRLLCGGFMAEFISMFKTPLSIEIAAWKG
jgi:hypothetical protein